MLFLLKFYLLERQSDRNEGERQRKFSCICWFTPWLYAMIRARWGQIWEPYPDPVWLAETQVCGHNLLPSWMPISRRLGGKQRHDSIPSAQAWDTGSTRSNLITPQSRPPVLCLYPPNSALWLLILLLFKSLELKWKFMYFLIFSPQVFCLKLFGKQFLCSFFFFFSTNMFFLTCNNCFLFF